MNNENRIEQWRLLENAPNIIIASTAVFFILSFMYNILYFQVLGIDLGRIPLTLTDYTLTMQIYTFSFIICILVIILCLCALKEIKPIMQNLNKFTTNKFFYISSRITNKFIYTSLVFIMKFIYISLLIICAFCISALFIAPLYFNRMFSTYWFNFYIVLFALLIILALVKDKLLIICFVVLLGVIIISFNVQYGVITAFSGKGVPIEINNKDYFLIRTLEKGFLVRDEDYNLGFKYLDSDIFLLYPITEEHKSYFDELVNIERNVDSKTTDNIVKEDVNAKTETN